MNTNEFIEMIGKIVQQKAFERGYNFPSAIIAQAVIESRNGNSLLAKKYHNYHGMKCGSYWKGKSVNLSTKEEYTKGTLTTIKDNFRVYDSVEEGILGYFDFINTKRYSNLKTATNSLNYLELLKFDGYATSFSYVETVYNIVRKYDLERYDKEMIKTDITEKMLTGDEIITLLAKEVLNGKYGNGSERKNKLGCLYELVQKKVNEIS